MKESIANSENVPIICSAAMRLAIVSIANIVVMVIKIVCTMKTRLIVIDTFQIIAMKLNFNVAVASVYIGIISAINIPTAPIGPTNMMVANRRYYFILSANRNPNSHARIVNV